MLRLARITIHGYEQRKAFMHQAAADLEAKRQNEEISSIVNILAIQLAAAMQACQAQVQALRAADAAVQAGVLVTRARDSSLSIGTIVENAP